ncbi:hypothetical protein [Pseudomonas typographi]|uniref:hypothetical protein n=1 Tax=Pseudomonas typographi TaxID=2715964 RepID=UPI001EEE0C1C|nr:hypothetical protein [Pseudomonas typographi]
MRAYWGLLSVTVFSLGAVEAAEFSSAQICKAAIAVETNRTPTSMKTERPGDTPQISYRREDGDVVRYRCRLEGTRVIWAAYLRDEKAWGRWRNAYNDGDAQTSYTIAEGKLTINNARSGNETFSRSDFSGQ